MRDERRAGTAQRQPGRVRPALPPTLRRERAVQGRLSPEPEGRQPVRLFAGYGAHGRGLPEDRGAAEAPGIRGGGDGHLPPPAGRKAAAHGGGIRRAGAGLLPQRLYGRLLAGQEGQGHVRHPAGERAGAKGAVRPRPRDIRKRKREPENTGEPAADGAPGRTGAAERRVRRPQRRDHSLGHRRRAGGSPEPGGDGGGADPASLQDRRHRVHGGQRGGGAGQGADGVRQCDQRPAAGAAGRAGSAAAGHPETAGAARTRRRARSGWRSPCPSPAPTS